MRIQREIAMASKNKGLFSLHFLKEIKHYEIIPGKNIMNKEMPCYLKLIFQLKEF